MILNSNSKNLSNFLFETPDIEIIGERNYNDPFVKILDNDVIKIKNIKGIKNVVPEIGKKYAISSNIGKNEAVYHRTFCGNVLKLKYIFIFNKEENKIDNSMVAFSNFQLFFKEENEKVIQGRFNVYELVGETNINPVIENITKNNITDLTQLREKLTNEICNSLEYAKRNQVSAPRAYVIDINTYGMKKQKILTEMFNVILEKEFKRIIG